MEHGELPKRRMASSFDMVRHRGAEVFTSNCYGAAVHVIEAGRLHFG